MMRNSLDSLRLPLQRALRSLIAGQTTPPSHLVGPRVDDGLFGPESATWRVHSQASMLVGGLRALLYQTAHPLAMAGVADHSDYRRDPLGRLHRTARFVGATTYGDTPTADAAIAQVRRIHRAVRGTAPDGRTYSATDPRLVLWVHATEVDSFLAAHQRYAPRPLSVSDSDRYVAEMAVIARRLGAKRPPTSLGALRDCLAGFDGELAVGRQARTAVRFLALPRAMPIAARPTYGLLFGAAVALLPGPVRSLHALPLVPGADSLAIRPATQVLLRMLGWALHSDQPEPVPPKYVRR